MFKIPLESQNVVHFVQLILIVNRNVFKGYQGSLFLFAHAVSRPNFYDFRVFHSVFSDSRIFWDLRWYIKGILSDPSGKDGNARITTILFKPFTNLWGQRTQCVYLLNDVSIAVLLKCTLACKSNKVLHYYWM